MSDGSMDGALRAAFEGAPGDSAVARLQRSTGVKSRILLHDAPDEESPLLRLGGAGGPGAEDDSRYRIVVEIAKGGVGVVYKAREVDLGRDVALKVLRREHASKPEVLERLVEEAQIGGQLQHPGIVPVYGLGLQADGRPYFAMKLIKGRTLAAALKDRKDPLRDLPRFLRVFEQICQTMAYAHTRGVIHRDVKPSKASRYRGLALRWLQSALSTLSGNIGDADAADALRRWKADADLAPVRDKIDGLPEAVRDAWRKLWVEVDALLARPAR